MLCTLFVGPFSILEPATFTHSANRCKILELEGNRWGSTPLGGLPLVVAFPAPKMVARLGNNSIELTTTVDIDNSEEQHENYIDSIFTSEGISSSENFMLE